jgi:hypothetical protein
MSTSSGTRTNSNRQGTLQALRQRGADATRRLRDTLNLPSDLTDSAILGTALAEIAIEESRSNPALASRIRQRYFEMASLRTSTAQNGTRRKAEPLPPLVAIRRDTAIREIDSFKPPDPKFLTYVYGHAQLGRALQDYTLVMLKQTAAKVQAEHPGTKPRSKSSNAAVIDYIVQYSGE